MQLPLYFAVFPSSPPESSADGCPLAALGYSFSPDGTEIIAPVPFPADLLVLNDSVLPPPGTPAPAAEHLLKIITRDKFTGVMFDFERPVNGFCTSFLAEVLPLLPHSVFRIVPPHYASLSQDSLVLFYDGQVCNRFAAQCAAWQRAYPNRWCLESAPWNYIVRDGREEACTCSHLQSLRHTEPWPETLLESACCMISAHNGEYRLFDTAETLRRKLELAEENGCCLSIGLYEELKYYF